VFLILDNIKAYHANVVKSWLELNKDELLNQDVKSNVVGRRRAKTLTELRNNIANYLFGTQRNPDIVNSYFLIQEVSYAA